MELGEPEGVLRLGLESTLAFKRGGRPESGDELRSEVWVAWTDM
jgi:hypothetical protein